MALTQVKSDGIATGAVTATQIATGAVTANDLEDSGVTAGTYGSSSAIPAITVDAKGRITSASTNSVTQVGGANGVDFNDSVKARFGTDNDLQVYHDGTSAFVAADDVRITNNAVTETMGKFLANGAASLYYDNSKKLDTTSTGINVTGTVNCDGLANGGTSTFSGDATFSGGAGAVSISSNSDIRFVDSPAWTGNTGSNAKIQQHGGYLYIVGGSNGIIFREDGTDRCRVDADGHFRPATNNTYDLGTSANRWRNVYTNDLNLSNEGGTNDVDGTWGSWTIQEGEDDLFLLNRRNGKKYKFALTEVN